MINLGPSRRRFERLKKAIERGKDPKSRALELGREFKERDGF